MEKWKISAEIDSTLSGMDMSQIAELATAIMDTWAPASSELISNSSQGLGVQQTDSQQVNKVFGTTIKQEVAAVPSEYEYPGTIPLPAYYQGVTTNSEQVPMDDYDPLESFSFWDGENFYTNHEMEGCGPSGTCDMQMDSSTMPTLPEYLGEDDLTHDDGFPVKDFDPTLAELNSCGDTGFEFSVNSSFLSEDSSFPLLSDNLSKSYPESHFVASPVSTSSIANSSFSSGINYIPTGFIDIKPNIQPPSLSSSCPVPSRLIPSNNSQFLNPYEEKFLICPQNSPAAETFFPAGAGSVEPKHHVVTKPRGIASPLIANRLQDSNLLSSSAPPDVTMSTYFTKIKTEPVAHSPGRRSITERSLSGFSSLSLSADDESGSFFDDDEEEHDDEEDYSSDEDVYQYDSDDASPNWPGSKEEKASQPRKHRYFWQYNLQSRGAKTHNILPRLETTDPHILNDAFDPVFSEECTLPVKHSGKARRGDGNDLTPDPRKLYNIGLELKKLNKLIYNVNPEGTGHGKPLSRKEKNKLASRVCRLKKKAQHEANKIKLFGLQKEHKKLLFIIMDTKELLRYKIENLQEKKLSNCSKKLETFLAANEPRRVAGNTAAFVNEVLEKVAKGDSDGGLSRL